VRIHLEVVEFLVDEFVAILEIEGADVLPSPVADGVKRADADWPAASPAAVATAAVAIWSRLLRVRLR